MPTRYFELYLMVVQKGLRPRGKESARGREGVEREEESGGGGEGGGEGRRCDQIISHKNRVIPHGGRGKSGPHTG